LAPKALKTQGQDTMTLPQYFMFYPHWICLTQGWSMGNLTFPFQFMWDLQYF